MSEFLLKNAVMASIFNITKKPETINKESLCAICMQHFKKPKILPGGQTLCELCLTEWLKKNNGELICPTCEQHLPLPSKGVPDITTYPFMKSLMVIVATRCKGSASERCENEEKYRCGDCGKQFCNYCMLIHKAMRVYQDDDGTGIVKCSAKTSGEQRFRMRQPRFCHNHIRDTLDIFWEILMDEKDDCPSLTDVIESILEFIESPLINVQDVQVYFQPMAQKVVLWKPGKAMEDYSMEYYAQIVQEAIPRTFYIDNLPKTNAPEKRQPVQYSFKHNRYTPAGNAFVEVSSTCPGNISRDINTQTDMQQIDEPFENVQFAEEVLHRRMRQKLPPTPNECEDMDVASSHQYFPVPSFDGVHLETVKLTDELPVNFSKGNYTSGIFDSRGGYLTIPGTSVELFVPPGAIDIGREQEISIQLNYRQENAPKLAEEESRVSPVVTCRPHGLSFKKSVLLSFPHSASGQGYKLKPLISDRTDGQSQEFTDLSNPEDGMLLYTEDRCLMLLNHFSDYTVKGESVFAKKLNFMIFADLHDEEEVKIRIWCLYHYSQQEVLDIERRMGGTEVDAPHPFTAYTAGGDVQVTVECNSEWQPLTPVQRIQMNRILDHQTCHQTIIITRQKASGRLRLTVRVTQPEHDKSDHVYINASVRVPQSADARHLNTSRCEYTSSNRVLPALPEGLLIAICQLMDPLEPCNRDWRLLADKITRDGKFLIDSDRKLLEQHSKDRSPTYTLLSIWQLPRRGFSLQNILDLRGLFESIGRTDVVELIDKFYCLCDQAGLENADTAVRPHIHAQMCNQGFYTVDGIASSTNHQLHRDDQTSQGVAVCDRAEELRTELAHSISSSPCQLPLQLVDHHDESVHAPGHLPRNAPLRISGMEQETFVHADRPKEESLVMHNVSSQHLTSHHQHQHQWMDDSNDDQVYIGSYGGNGDRTNPYRTFSQEVRDNELEARRWLLSDAQKPSANISQRTTVHQSLPTYNERDSKEVNTTNIALMHNHRQDQDAEIPCDHLYEGEDLTPQGFTTERVNDPPQACSASSKSLSVPPEHTHAESGDRKEINKETQPDEIQAPSIDLEDDHDSGTDVEQGCQEKKGEADACNDSAYFSLIRGHTSKINNSRKNSVPTSESLQLQFNNLKLEGKDVSRLQNVDQKVDVSDSDSKMSKDENDFDIDSVTSDDEPCAMANDTDLSESENCQGTDHDAIKINDLPSHGKSENDTRTCNETSHARDVDTACSEHNGQQDSDDHLMLPTETLSEPVLTKTMTDKKSKGEICNGSSSDDSGYNEGEEEVQVA